MAPPMRDTDTSSSSLPSAVNPRGECTGIQMGDGEGDGSHGSGVVYAKGHLCFITVHSIL